MTDTTQVALGAVEMHLGIDNGKVMQRFKEPTLLVLYDPQNALDVAGRIADLAFECRDGVKPVSDTLKAELVERHRMTLTARVAHMLHSLREDKTRTDGQVAQAVVEACLKEVF
jgi:ABC-type cobalamin/Fe3+-siderophores transport system ATPase subunit